MSANGSLRDLYAAPSSSWSFETSGPSTTQPTAPVPSTTTPSPQQWRARVPQNSIFELTGALDMDPGYVSATLLLKGIVASAFLQYGSTAIAMPWEVGKMLLQVQWVPRDADALAASESVPNEEEEEDSESSIEDDSYFADPSDPDSTRAYRSQQGGRGAARHTGAAGGLVEPEYVIPVGSASGVWGMIKRVGRFRGEGWLALEKGLLTSCIHDMLSTTLQPTILYALQGALVTPVSLFQQPHFLLPVASHLLTGFLLSPLDLIRTRLIVQSSLPQHRTYNGPVDALSQILRHEGGWKGIYLHPQLLIPTLLDSTLRPLISLALPGILTSYLGAAHISEDSHPLLWGLVEFLASCGGLLLTLPFETIRRRLQVQVRGVAKPIKTCVETRPAPYNGIVDAFWHILTEERSDLPLEDNRHSRMRRPSTNGREQGHGASEADDQSWSRRSGLGQLYRGFGMRLGASVLVFLLGALTGSEDRDGGWAEI
ncbi:mitochondrial carrier [Punctularia strigosozonata HHB-11173 SS5]|uniref:mitochondrial carrier n=1 Tax=Punctularia strigosozonata (strain HHB-11173) TaxID=741275 RepID=UPI000441871F|nr:mitochondrial carrier [Punctularia strigosozonata HHB-11173 SS5]EIN13666.1 mitochondrial carrier [Punctularia strigosozonata HHB-11173 SS5]